MNNYLKLNNLSKKYEGNKSLKVLNNINFKFESGKVYSIVGPSGSGKSTLLNLLSLIDIPSSGFIEYNNKKIDTNSTIENDSIRSKNIGIIYQDKNLLADFTALENVLFPSLLVTKDKKKSIDLAKKLIKQFGLNFRFNHFPSELSGGESQRIAICRALVNSPNIILADEPTGNLDYKNAKEIFKMFISLKNKDRILIFATHNRYFANKADCKIELLDGKIKVANVRN